QYARPVPSGRHERADAGLRGGHAVQHHAGAADDEADLAARGRQRIAISSKPSQVRPGAQMARRPTTPRKISSLSSHTPIRAAATASDLRWMSPAHEARDVSASEQ